MVSVGLVVSTDLVVSTSFVLSLVQVVVSKFVVSGDVVTVSFVVWL